MTHLVIAKIAKSRPNRMAGPRGMTLVEMLVAMAITLILVGVVAQLFGMLGGSISASRSIIETNDQLRAVALKLRTDLAGITVDPIPPLRPESATGYLEIIEGPNNDYAVNYSPTSSLITLPNGDCDDALLFTTQSQGDPFVGRFNASTLESSTAEVSWFCVASGSAAGIPLFSLYRRQLLVTALVGAGDFAANNSVAETLPNAYSTYDLSLRAENGRLYPNSLADLTKRENRFINRGSSYPYKLNAMGTNGLIFDASSGRQGEDLVLTNVIGFDVRVFDPDAEIKTLGGGGVTPGDPGFGAASPTSSGVSGAYVDLGALGGPSTLLASMHPKSLLTGPKVYDTWSLHYEFNGVNDDGDGSIDEGTNSVDDDGNGIVDDLGERETIAPYPVPLRGIEVRIRCYEPSSRQVRQVTVRHTFVPQ